MREGMETTLALPPIIPLDFRQSDCRQSQDEESSRSLAAAAADSRLDNTDFSLSLSSCFTLSFHCFYESGGRI